MKHLLLLFVLSFFSLATFAQKSAQFKFNVETYDFGNIKEGDPASYDFVFTNVGNEPLVISNCTASCGCTIPSWNREPVMPGQTGKITVKYDTKGKSSAFNKSIYIQSNAVKNPYEITIKGNVIAK